jgi:hypothetical protein
MPIPTNFLGFAGRPYWSYKPAVQLISNTIKHVPLKTIKKIIKNGSNSLWWSSEAALR